jgi:hypothetical protein
VLFHISEEANIQLFQPRPSEYTAEPAVWALDALHLRNYLVPRDCPRVTYYAGAQTTSADRTQFLGSSSAVVAIEQDWVNRVRQCRLYCYTLASHTFECIDECAGYFISRVAVAPVAVELVEDVVFELQRRGVEIRILPNLWSLADAVVASSLSFSNIRMRNARPRDVGR